MTPAGLLVLGHRRLAIFDLDARADQPMRDKTGRLTIVFNGAIYNFREIRLELEKLGRGFRTASDTEVLLEAYATWGRACLDKLNGMFAFVIFDAATSTLFAARDRFGVKPLYLWAANGNIAFSSEIKQLLTISEVSARVNTDALHDFLMFGVTDHGRATCFADIGIIPPGHAVTLDLAKPLPPSTDAVTPERWYRLPSADNNAVSPEEAARELGRCLKSSVELRLSADVAVGSCLSGGLDSSAIVGMIATLRQSGGQTGQQQCVSAVYPGQRVDESRYVNAAAERWPGIVVHKIEPQPEHLAQTLERIVWHQDEPFGSTSIFAQWSVFEKARAAGLTVMLDGQGADELFGGYHPMHGAHLADLLAGGQIVTAFASARALERTAGLSLLRQGLWTAAALAPDALTIRARSWTGDGSMAGWLRDTSGSYRVPLVGGGDRASGITPHMDRMSRRLVSATSLPMLLRFEDRNSMAHGIEARVPFLDYRLVEAAMRLGGRFNIRDGESKWIARRAFAGVLPDAVLARRDKIGFATPETHWLRGPLAPLARSSIAMAIDTLRPHLDADRVRRDTGAMLSGAKPLDGSLWRLWCAGLWAKVFGLATG